MTVFVWTHPKMGNPDNMSKDEFSTCWAIPTPECRFCGDRFDEGERVFHWRIDGSPADIVAHADCVKKYARGLIKDIAECTR